MKTSIALIALSAVIASGTAEAQVVGYYGSMPIAYAPAYSPYPAYYPYYYQPSVYAYPAPVVYAPPPVLHTQYVPPPLHKTAVHKKTVHKTTEAHCVVPASPPATKVE